MSGPLPSPWIDDTLCQCANVGCNYTLIIMTLAAETPYRRHHRQSSHWSFEDRVQRLPSGCVSGKKKIVDNHPIARCRNTGNYYFYVFMCSPAIITIPTKHIIRKNINGERRTIWGKHRSGQWKWTAFDSICYLANKNKYKFRKLLKTVNVVIQISFRPMTCTVFRSTFFRSKVF